ncbi:uncharacterized protein [Prorops nasuta]|uniref:uncharacterized protein n=1 Tax=Prorops nasuta TaxID=863751 RepID=UPI0034CD8FF2
MSERRKSDNLNMTNILNSASASSTDFSNLLVEKSIGKSGANKFSFCYYCQTKQQKIARHLEIKHKSEPDVQKFILLPKNCQERKEIIATIRKKGNFLYNTDENFNQGTLIVARRVMANKNKTAENFVACANCKGFYAENSIRIHFAKCVGRNSKNKRVVNVLGRAIVGKIHNRASNTVRTRLFPVLREDDITRLVRYDSLVILYANKMCEKYKNSDHHFNMIRARIRLIGRFLKTVMSFEKDITDLASVFDPKYVDNVINTINIEAGLNEAKTSYKTPSVAFALGTLLKKIGELLIIESIKNHNQEHKKLIKDFLKVLSLDLNININKTVMETQVQQTRRKKVELPSTEDISKLRLYLSKKITDDMHKLKNSFDLYTWADLVESTLTSVQLLNRRRAGEVERIMVEDYMSYQKVNEKIDKVAYNSLSKKHQEAIQKYARFTIRGKLNRTVSVLLNNMQHNSVEMILKYRENAGVHPKNPYLFAIPENKNGFYRACHLLMKFSVECGAEHPHRLRGTNLRKHIATKCISLNLSENEVSDLANFMGHAEKIHKNIYRQPLIDREIVKMSYLLEKAQGEESSDKDTDDSEFSDVEDSNFSSTNKSPHFSGSRITEVTSPKIKTSKKRRSTSPYGAVKRRRWSIKEKDAVLSTFNENLKNGSLPSLKRIQEIITANPCLHQRTAAQIKTWLHNQLKCKK